MKKVQAALRTVAQLKALPQEMLPSTLKHKIVLDNVESILIHYRPMCKQLGGSLQFLRKYGPDIRFHNPNVLVQRKKDPEGPYLLSFEVKLKTSLEVKVIKVADLKTPQEIRDAILKLDKQSLSDL